MKKAAIISVIIFILVLAGTVYYGRFGNKTRTFTNPAPQTTDTFKTAPMTIASPAFQDGQNIPAKYTCDGDNANPPLQFFDVPKGTQGLAIVVDDPDAPAGTWVHWLAWNINPTTAEIKEGAVPAEATEGTTSFGQTGYGGPCPPAGSPHHYHFKLYALDAKLNLPTRTVESGLESAMNGHILAHAELVGLYGR